jgi:hypothetical protein
MKLNLSLFMMLLATGRAHEMPMHVWILRNFGIGLVLGVSAWLLHFLLLWRVEEWLKGFKRGKEATTNTVQNESKTDG